MDMFAHLRVIMGIILSLSIARLLTGLARIVQHPGREKVYWVHLAWVLSLFLSLLHLWWWEFGLTRIDQWRFITFTFVIIYVIPYFFLAILLFPEDLEDYHGYRDYFYSRRKWFFGILALVYAMDLVDTAVKGSEYFTSFGIEYPIRNITYITLCIVAASTSKSWFHKAFVVVNLIYQVSWIWRQFEVLR